MKDSIFLTFDIDWASDGVIRRVAEQLVEAKIKSTWFVTHDSPILDFFRSRKDLFSLGIHPNFLEGTSHGNSEEEILINLMNLVPEAKVMRTHGVYQYGNLLSKIVKLSPISIDSSIFLPEMSNIKPFEHLTPNGSLKRIPIFWADDYELLKNGSDWNPEKYFTQPGFKVFLFHPIHIFLNTSNMDQYNQYKFKKITPNKNKSNGVNTFFTRLINFINNKGYNSNFLK